MTVALIVDFKMDGPFGNEMTEQFSELAESINNEEGFIRKIWTEKEEEGEAGGVYIFDSKKNAQKYLDMHRERLKEMGVPQLNAKIYDINDKLTEITKGLVQ